MSAEWSELYVAAAGASAALAGLVFVAVSINLDDILNGEGLPDLAVVTLLLLVGVLIVSDLRRRDRFDRRRGGQRLDPSGGDPSLDIRAHVPWR